MKKILTSLTLAALSAALLSAAAVDLRKAEAAISSLELYQWVKTLSDKPFAGRLSGHPGYTAAANWAAAKMKEFGLKPIDAKNGYLQPFPSPVTVIESGGLQADLWKIEQGKEVPAGTLTAEAMTDFFPLVFSDSAEVTADLVFCGWGINAPDLGYDDFAGVDVKGKYVVCFRGTPDRDRRWQYHDEHRTRMKVAMSKGAKGLVYIYPEINVHPNGDLTPNFTPMMISDAFADKILAAQKFTCAQLKRDLQIYKKPLSFPIQARFRYKVKTRHDAKAVTYNIAGWIEGSDPKLRNEAVILGGHFDGVGEHMGFFCPGANDNASGSAILLGVAKALGKLPARPKRSIMVVLFAAEEKGMLGSDYFAKNLPAPLTKMIAMFNFDMAGAGDRVSAAVSPAPADLKATLLAADESSKLIEGTWPMGPPGVRGGDVTAFYNMGVPCLYFMTNGPFPEYHRTGDSIYRVNPDIMGELARLTLRAAVLYADR